MKTITLSLFLLFVLTNHVSPAAADSVLDVEGNEVIAGVKYYVIGAVWAPGGGGLDLGSGRNGQCPMDVIQQPSDSNKGTSVTFYPADTTTTVVQTSSNLNIKFNVEPNTTCDNQLPVWKVDNYDNETEQWFITTGGVVGNPGPETIRNWFKFEKSNWRTGTYKIVHCPSVSEFCPGTLCRDMGIFFYNDQRYFALTNSGLPPLGLVKDSDDLKSRTRVNAII